jgi:hypothetical protein
MVRFGTDSMLGGVLPMGVVVGQLVVCAPRPLRAVVFVSTNTMAT